MTKILITVQNIEINVAGDDSDAGWQMLIAEPRTFDLVAVAGIEETLGFAQLEAGSYGQVRMEVVEALVTVGGEERTARVPSDRLRFVGGIDLAPGQTRIITLDFDANRSIVLRGN